MFEFLFPRQVFRRLPTTSFPNNFEIFLKRARLISYIILFSGFDLLIRRNTFVKYLFADTLCVCVCVWFAHNTANTIGFCLADFWPNFPLTRLGFLRGTTMENRLSSADFIMEMFYYYAKHDRERIRLLETPPRPSSGVFIYLFGGFKTVRGMHEKQIYHSTIYTRCFKIMC